MRAFRWLAVGCGAAAVAVGAFTGGVWVMRTNPVAVVTPKPVPPPVRTVPSKVESTKPAVQPEWSVTVRPANHELPTPVPLPPIPDTKLMPLPAPAGLVEPAVASLPAPTIPPVPKPAELPTRYVNKPDLEFDYEVTKQGKSGVKAVTLYTSVLPPLVPPGVPGFGFSTSATLPGVDVWTEAAKLEVGEPAGRPKLTYTLEKEGRYGFRVGVSSGTVTAAPPKNTDDPEMVVVFDKTPPVIEKMFTEIYPGQNGTPHPTAVEFGWVVKEAHPSDAPPVLEYQAPGGEKWLPITGNSTATNLGWTIPNEAPAAVKVRLTVTDKAGNTAQKVIEAVNLDHTVPAGRLTGVSATEGKREALPPPKSDEPKK